MVHVVAQVEDPYGRREDPNHPPLAAGLFVHAEIMGHMAEDVIVVPRAAMRGYDELLVIDDEERLRFRRVHVLRSEGERVLIRGGLREGERVCLSPLEAVTDGMRVRATEVEPDPPRLQREPVESPQPTRAESHAKRTDASAEPEVAP
jgi:hypothetical protein